LASKGLKPTKADVLRRQNPDAFDDSSDEDTSDPLQTLPFDLDYIAYLVKNPKAAVDMDTIRFWQKEAKVHRFNKYDQ
jgi:hypothetical protein